MEPTTLDRIVDSRYYETFSAALIILNAIFIGWQTQYISKHLEEQHLQNVPLNLDHQSDLFLVIQVFFCLAFSVELGLRWARDGFIKFFLNTEMEWNVFD